MRKAAKGLIGALVLATLGAGGWIFSGPIAAVLDDHPAEPEARRDTPKTPQNPDIVHVDEASLKQLSLATGEATEREIFKKVEVPGIVAFDDRLITHLKPRTKGRVLTLAVQPGDKVKAGDVLATLDASGVLDAQNGLDMAKASLGEAKATSEAATIALTRAGALLKIGGVAKAEVERRQVELAKAQASVQSAQARVDMYAAQFERLAPSRDAAPGTSEIVAPFDGVVVSAHITLGEVVDTVQDAFTIADPSKVLVLASLFGFDINAVERGDKAVIRAPLGERADFDAHVVSVNAALDPLTNAAPARLEVENRKGALRANMFVSVEIAADLGRRGVAIPAAAVQQTEKGPVAFVRTGAETFEKRDLKLGLERTDWVEVEQGVKTGETVVTKGSFDVKALLVRNLLGAAN